MPKTILIVDDEDPQRRILKIALEKVGYVTLEARDGQEALDMLLKEGEVGVDVVLLDLVMGGVGGMEVLEQLQHGRPDLPVIVLTAHSSVDKAVGAMQLGAADFIAKPAGVNRLKVSIDNVLKLGQLSEEVLRLNHSGPVVASFDNMVGASESLKEAIGLARKGAATNVPILLEGESGVGKEVFARAVQGASERSDAPFIVVNCGAIPANLVESILFGHEVGAFTGAIEKQNGKFLDADGGTIFLDEIGELPLDLQVKLLRVLQEGEIEPVGGQTVPVDVRVISATNKNLKSLSEQGLFREDLYYRLNVYPVYLPPLRKRSGDIEKLARYFNQQISLSENRPEKDFSEAAITLLKQYHWPGNVRQLENAIFRAVILSEGDKIEAADFPQVLSINQKRDRRRNDIIVGPISISDDVGDVRPLCEVEEDVIRYAIEKYDGKMSEVARRLGIGRSTLYRKVADMGLDELNEPRDEK